MSQGLQRSQHFQILKEDIQIFATKACHFLAFIKGAPLIYLICPFPYSVMVNLELPHVNVLSKMDLLGAQAKKQLDDFLHPNTRDLSSSSHSNSFNEKYQALTQSLGKVLDDYR